MRIYFSGIGGVGIGPLALIAKKAGYSVAGSDAAHSLTTEKLLADNVDISIGEQDGTFLRQEHARRPFDFFVYTAALAQDHAELNVARQLGIDCYKRDGLLSRILDATNLEMIAVAGTHGKTGTASLLVWVLRQLDIPVSYSIGTTLDWAPAGDYDPASRFFVYECDEFDRNFLHFTPRVSLITSIDYDHPDTFSTDAEYRQAFCDFIDQSDDSLMWQSDFASLPEEPRDVSVFDEAATNLSHLHLTGEHIRRNAFLVERAVRDLFPEVPYAALIQAINSFPGVGRRMEQLGPRFYTDYAHHPAEIAATLQAAHELSDNVVLVYQPHQNVRQHLVSDEYTRDVFAHAQALYWLPTYLSREDPSLEVLTPLELTSQLDKDSLYFADLNESLWESVRDHLDSGALVICMGAGSIDEWARRHAARL